MAVGSAMGRLGAASPQEPNGKVPSSALPAAGTDASFGEEDDFQADVRGNGDGAATAGSSWPKAQPSAGGQAFGEDFGSFNAGVLTKPASEATNIPIGGERRKPKVRPPVAIGWGLLALLLIILAAMLALARTSVVSALPGAARLYAMLGKPVALHALAIQDVHYAWVDAAGAPVLSVQGNIVNLTSGTVTVPDVVIALQDDSGKEISAFTTKVAPLVAGARAPFTAQISSPPKTVRSLKVRFAKAG